MPVTVSHSLSMTTPDDPAYENQPKHWNSNHYANLNAVGSEISGAFNNGGGVTFGLETNGSITAAAPAAAPSPVNFSAGTTSNNLASVIFANGNGVSFGLNTGASSRSITASIATTYAGTGFTSAATAGTAVVATNNTAGLSMGIPAYITTAMLSNAATISNINVSAGTTSTNASAFTFSNSNNMTFGLGTGGSAGVMTASFNAINVGVSTGGNTLGTTGTIEGAGGQYLFVGGSNITLSQSTNGANSGTVTVIGPVGDTVTQSQYYRPIAAMATIGAPVQNSASFVDCKIDANLSFSRFDLAASVNVGTAANNSSAGILYTLTAAMYSNNAGTLSSMFSAVTNNQATWTSNLTASVTGVLFLSAPLAGSVKPGNYWIGAQLSTRATGLSGANTTSLGNTFSMMGVLTNVFIAISAHEPGANTADNQQWYQGLGIYSGTTNFSVLSITNITGVGSGANRANVVLRLINQ